MGEGAPKPRKEEAEIELLPADPEADDMVAREQGASDIESGAKRIEADIAELLEKRELSDEEKGRLARLREDHAEWLSHAKGIREAK